MQCPFSHCTLCECCRHECCECCRHKKEYLTKLSTSIVDKYIFDEVKHKKIAKAVKQLEERELRDSKDRTLDGRYKCRFPGCKKTFQSDGKWRRSHEQSHSPPVSIQEQPLLTEIHDDVVQDDMFNYQKALLDYGMVILNFFDAISEGDGARIIRNFFYCICIMTKVAISMLWKAFICSSR